MAGNIPYIGSKISLITTSDIRYEGILYTLNREESTIAVQNVRSFGTEGRRCPEVPMSNEIYDFIIFRGKDLKDLTVIQGAPERPSPNSFGAGADYMDSQSSSLYGQSPSDPYGSSLAQSGGAAHPSSMSSAYQRQSVGSTAPARNGYAAAAPPPAASLGPMASSYSGGGSYATPPSSGSRPVDKLPSPTAAYGAVSASRSPFPSPADPLGASSLAAPLPTSHAPGLSCYGAADEGNGTPIVRGLGAAQQASAEARSSSESKERLLAAEPKAQLDAAAAAVAAAARGRGKGGGAQKKSLYEVLRFHPRAQELITKTMRSQNTSNVQPSELRAMSEMNPSVYHFYVDYLNYCCASHTVQSDEQQWESLGKALKKHFEKEFGANQNQKPAQPQRPNNTLGDFITIEANSKAGKKNAKIAPVPRGGGGGGGRVGRGTGRGDKRDGPDSGEYEGSVGPEDVGSQTVSWVCPRCTLRNENLLLECAACGTSKQQAALWAEFPPLG
mmetsp:Transcript_119385/g.380725  ORF Transcript_119385/g.380725 Transcript_119385/m.380725 type:complete len:500 (-) Transcript_119385:664-2163(-)